MNSGCHGFNIDVAFKIQIFVHFFLGYVFCIFIFLLFLGCIFLYFICIFFSSQVYHSIYMIYVCVVIVLYFFCLMCRC